MVRLMLEKNIFDVTQVTDENVFRGDNHQSVNGDAAAERLIESIQQVAPGINNPVTCDEEV
jgi:hypothetical protein